MTYFTGEATTEDPPVLHAVIGLADQIEAASDEIERGCRVPQSIAAAMKEAGVFGMAMPRAWGGPEVDPLAQIRVIEALAMADGSVGWCAMIGCDSGYVSAFLDQDVAREMYSDLLVATGAAATTTGEAPRVPGGYRVYGRFPFVSGCHHCEWVWLGCTVFENRSQRVGDDGVPKQGNVSCDYRSARSWTRGTRPGCAAPAATISPSATYSFRRSLPSASRTLSWSNGPARFTRSRLCSSRRDLARHSGSPATQSTH
ncbi:MAG: acyl-CoA dehydrogenase family protein [Stellaceae bacterium]